jgi:hypothetical protein
MSEKRLTRTRENGLPKDYQYGASKPPVPKLVSYSLTMNGVTTRHVISANSFSLMNGGIYVIDPNPQVIMGIEDVRVLGPQ